MLRTRLTSAETLNTDVANWLRDRARIETSYAAELEKLGNRQVPNLSESLSVVWDSLLQSTRDISNASSTLASKIFVDVEQPMRTFNKGHQWMEIKPLCDELDSQAQLLQSHQDKVDKLLRKPSRQNQEFEIAQHSLTEVQLQWESRASSLINQIEGIDGSRLELLKSTLITLGTMQTDHCTKAGTANEALLNDLFKFEPTKDLEDFAAKVSNGDIRPPPRLMQMRNGSTSDASAMGRSTTGESEVVPELPTFVPSSGSKLRSKMGSIFRSSKKKNKQPAQPEVYAMTGESPAMPSTPVTPGPANRGTPGTPRTPATPGVSEPVPRGRYRGTAVHEDASKRPPPPPPAARKSNGPFVPSVSAASREQFRFDNSFERNLPDTPEESIRSQPLASPVEGELPDKPSRFSIAINQASIQPSGDDDVALSVVASQLRARKTISGRGQRGRRDIQSTLFQGIGPTGDDNIPTATAITSDAPLSATGSSTVTLSPIQDTTIADSVQYPAIVPTLNHQPMPNAPGLNATFEKTISAVITDGNVTRAQLVGEIVVGYQGPIGATLALKVGNLDQFDTIRPNEVYAPLVKTIDLAAGLFTVDTTVLNGNVGAAFKVMSYDAQRYVPVDFTPIWRIEPNQSSLMLSYKLSDTFLPLCKTSPLVLHDLVITVPVEGGKATSALSKPHAVFNRTKQQIVWKFTEPIALYAGTEDRLLCRFGTEGGVVQESSLGISVSYKVLPTTLDEKEVTLSYSEKLEGADWKTIQPVVSISTGKFQVHSQENVQNKAGVNGNGNV